MTPTALKRGGAGETIRYATVDSPLGRMLVAATARGLCSVAFADSDDELIQQLRERFPKAELKPLERELSYAVEALLSLMTEHPAAADLPLDVRATAFQQRVWRELRQIPRGETRTYTQIAAALESPGSVRAVAAACAANPLAVLVPCHRVIGKSGALTGYRWGVERKRQLLAAEKGAMKISTPWRTAPRPNLAPPIPKAYTPWIIVSTLALIGGLLLLAVAVTAAFVTFAAVGTPLWVIILGVFAVIGIALGFGGLFLLLGAAAWSSWRESRRIEVLPPE